MYPTCKAMGTLEERDQKRAEVLEKIAGDRHNKVVAVTPIAYMDYIRKFLKRKNVLAIELRDTPENIFDRLVFSDENDVIYYDDDYKNAHRDHYLRDIREDIRYYGTYSFRSIRNKFDMEGLAPEAVVESLIHDYHLLPE